MKVLHITTVHPRRDTRIFYRECCGLQRLGYSVTLIVADGKGNELIEGVNIIDIGSNRNRIFKLIEDYRHVLKIVKKIKPRIVHLHDPELVIVGSRIGKKFKNCTVVFDIHENIPSQILDKPYLPKLLRKPTSWCYRKIEDCLIKNFNLVVAEHSYLERYGEKGKSITIVLNMPELNHFSPFIKKNRTGNEIFYIGEISEHRCIHEVLQALKILHSQGIDFFMHFIGPMTKKTEESLDIGSIQNKIKFYGRMDSKRGFELSKRCVIGISMLKPIKNFVHSYSTKIFEYMAIGLPVITSDFLLYTNVVEKHQCGYCINPKSSEALANKIGYLLDNPEVATKMGANGVNAIKNHFNWSSEEVKLHALYKKIGKYTYAS